MKRLRFCLALAAPTVAVAESVGPALTIYNQNFAVVRDHVALDLKPGENQVRFADTRAHLSPIQLFSSTRKAKPTCRFSNKTTATIRFRRSCSSRFSKARRSTFS